MRQRTGIAFAVFAGLCLTANVAANGDHRYGTSYRNGGYNTGRTGYGGYRTYQGNRYIINQYRYRPVIPVPYIGNQYSTRRSYPGFSGGYVNPTVQYHYTAPRVTTGYGYQSYGYQSYGRGYRGGYVQPSYGRYSRRRY